MIVISGQQLKYKQKKYLFYKHLLKDHIKREKSALSKLSLKDI